MKLLPNALLFASAALAACSTPTVGGPCDPFASSDHAGEACAEQMYFPTGLSIDPKGDTLYVSNGNADLRYAGGTLQAIDLRAFRCAYQYARTGAWPADGCSSSSMTLLKCAMDYASSKFTAVPAGCDAGRLGQLFNETNRTRIGDFGLCRPDLLDPAILECDEQLFIAGALSAAGSSAQGAVRVGNFAGALALQPSLAGDQSTRRLWVTVRGDPSVTWATVTRSADGDVVLGCDDKSPHAGLPDACTDQRITVRDFHDSTHPKCDSGHVDQCTSVPPEPFGLAFDEGKWESLGNGVCNDGTPCDAGNPCLDRSTCISDGKGICGDKRTRCSSSSECAGGTICYLPHADRYQHLLVSHLLGGEVMLVNAAARYPSSTTASPPTEPVVLDVRGVGFVPDGSGRVGGFGLAAREPGNPRSLWYATSRVNSRIAIFRVGFSNIILPFTTFSLVGPLIPGDDGRDLVFDPCDDRGPGNAGCRAFALDNHPPSLLTIDTRIDPLRVPAGVPQNTVTDAVSVCQGPSHLAFRWIIDPITGGRRNRVYVLCYAANQMAVIDPDISQLVDSVLVGRGPNEIAFNFGAGLDSVATGEPRAFVTNFLDNSISVVDLEPGSRTENHVVARIGFTEPPRLQ